MGGWRYSSTYLNCGTKWRGAVNFMFPPNYPLDKEPLVHIGNVIYIYCFDYKESVVK
jgi:hypothetical protein